MSQWQSQPVCVAAVALAALSSACSKPSPASIASSAPSASSAPVAQPRLVTQQPLSSVTAFELAVREGGLSLLWAAVESGPGWLKSVELAQNGEAHAAPRSLAVPARGLGKVVDLAAVSMGEELALAWVEQGKAEARAQAAVLSPAGPPASLDLGAAAVSAEAARGNIAIAAESEKGRALVMWRGLEAPCVDPQSKAACVGFTFRRVRAGGAEDTGLPMSVPVPCVSHSVQLAVSSGRFHYGVCTREGAEPVTTMFSIQYEPDYARAEPLLKGCLPLGTIEAAGQPWLIADCHGKRKAATVPLTDEKVQQEYVDAPRISCTPERAELRQGRFVLSLREPRAGLEALLPPAFLPTGARAGWSGKSLVVAYVAGDRLETRAFTCRGGTLEPL